MARVQPDLSPMGRWLRVVNAFLERETWGIRDLAAATGLPRSAVHRIAHEMVRHGLLAPADEMGRFRIGPGLVRLAVLVSDRIDLPRLAHPILDATMQRCGETVVLALYSPERRQVWAVDAAESAEPIRYIWASLREWGDLHVGSSGKGVLAFLPDDERERIIAGLPDPIPGLRPMSHHELRDQLDRARTLGYVVSRGERYAGAMGAAAPIRDASGRVIGDVIIGWPDNRTAPGRPDAFGRLARDAARDLSRTLGYVGPDEAAG